MSKPNPIKLAITAWDEVERLEAMLKRAKDESERGCILADLRMARHEAHYWQQIVNDDRGWV